VRSLARVPRLNEFYRILDDLSPKRTARSRFLLRGLAAPVLHFALVESHGRIVGGGPANGQVAAQFGHHIGTNPMDDRIEAFLADVLALEGEELDAIRAGVRVALGDVETIFRAQEDNRRKKDKAAHACHALCRARVVEEIQRRRATTTAEHLKLALSIIDKPTNFPLQDH
jgi:hypothetical protein